MAIININSTDFSKNVVVGTYKVNSQDVYNSWTDANGNNHRHIIRKRISGSFTVGFRNPEEYQRFLNAVNGYNIDGAVPCDVWVNNLNDSYQAYLYFSMTPSLSRNGTRNYIPNFEVSVEER